MQPDLIVTSWKDPTAWAARARLTLYTSERELMSYTDPMAYPIRKSVCQPLALAANEGPACIFVCNTAQPIPGYHYIKWLTQVRDKKRDRQERTQDLVKHGACMCTCTRTSVLTP